jgi:hypothetical protein
MGPKIFAYKSLIQPSLAPAYKGIVRGALFDINCELRRRGLHPNHNKLSVIVRCVQIITIRIYLYCYNSSRYGPGRSDSSPHITARLFDTRRDRYIGGIHAYLPFITTFRKAKGEWKGVKFEDKMKYLYKIWGLIFLFFVIGLSWYLG